MIAMYGGAGTIGKSGILGVEAATNQAVCCIEPNYEIFSPRYLLNYFIYFRPHWMRFAIGTRKDPNISKTTIINTQIPLPTPEEQNEIVKVLDTLTWKVSYAETKKALLNDLFQTLLHQLMTAQIRVNDIDLPGFQD
jgi:type I restriction enzyme, S subunit